MMLKEEVILLSEPGNPLTYEAAACPGARDGYHDRLVGWISMESSPLHSGFLTTVAI